MVSTYVGTGPVMISPLKSPSIPVWSNMPMILIVSAAVSDVNSIVPDNVSIPLALICASIVPSILPDTVPEKVVRLPIPVTLPSIIKSSLP